MLLTIFYTIATWIQAWRISSLREKLAAAVIPKDNCPGPSIIFQARTRKSSEECDESVNNDCLSSKFCDNRENARLADLLWFHGDNQLFTIYPQQRVDLSSWLKFPKGSTFFPLLCANTEQVKLEESTKMQILVEADMENYHSVGDAKATKLEDYGQLVTWNSIDESLGVIMETDLDLLTKLLLSLMNGSHFINNGLQLKSIESVVPSGSPCVFDDRLMTALHDRKLIGKQQFEAQMTKIRAFSRTAGLVAKSQESLEIDELPGVTINTADCSNSVILEVPDLNSHCPSSLASREKLFESTETISTKGHAFSSMDSILEDSVSKRSVKTEIVVIESPLQRLRYSSRSSSISAANFPTVPGAKPPNVLIYADSTSNSEVLRAMLQQVLSLNRYTFYVMSKDEMNSDVWMDNAVLVVVFGNVGGEVNSQLIDYLLRGGKLLAICSDTLHSFLPSFKTTEVREKEIVRFSYGKWKQVRLMHHIFCYQASPLKSRFSQDNEDQKPNSAQQPPIRTTVQDRSGNSHKMNVEILGTEDTWHTPSILMAKVGNSESNLPEGKAVFSQIHLESDPSQFEFEAKIFDILRKSETDRMSILKDLLEKHLEMAVQQGSNHEFNYTPGFFLGRHELKLAMVDELHKKKALNETILRLPQLNLQFIFNKSEPLQATPALLPIYMHRCPDNFSTVDYFDNLKTQRIGRLVIYTDVITSSMFIVEGAAFHDGLAVIPRQQTKGVGRNRNSWLSPIGTAAFSLQLQIPRNSILGERIPLIQHVISCCIVTAVKSIPGLSELEIYLKWPNDIYSFDLKKLGGNIVKTTIDSATITCNIGAGTNLANSQPTTCINDLIDEYNKRNKTKVPRIKQEKFFAFVFNEIERLIDVIQTGGLDEFYELYYANWMHNDAEITIISANGSSEEVTVVGIDSYGFLEVQSRNGKIFSVHPDGNSFDITRGLIAPSKI